MATDRQLIIEHVRALRERIAPLETALSASDAWLALTQLERRLRDGSPLEAVDVRALKARLEGELALEPAFRSWRELTDTARELDTYLERREMPAIAWATIAARASGSTSAQGSAVPFRTRIRARLTQRENPLVARLLNKLRADGAMSPPAAPTSARSATASPIELAASRAAAIIARQQLETEAAREAAIASGRPDRGANDTILTPTRLTDRLAGAVADQTEPQPVSETDAETAELAEPNALPIGVAPPVQREPPPPLAPEDSQTRLARLETEVDALMLSVGGEADMPPMPLARRPIVSVGAATTEASRPAHPMVNTAAAPQRVAAPTAPDADPGRIPPLLLDDIDEDDPAPDDEAQVMIVRRAASSDGSIGGAAGSALAVRRSRLTQRLNAMLSGAAFNSDGYAAYRASVEEAAVVIVPPGGVPPPSQDTTKDGEPEDVGAVLRFLAVLNGRSHRL